MQHRPDSQRAGAVTLSELLFAVGGVCITSKKLLCVVLGIGISRIDHMERVGLCDAVNGEGTDALLVGDNRLVQKTDPHAPGNQRLDGNKAADGNLSGKIVQRISGCHQPFFKNTPGAGAFLPNDDGFFQ